MLFQSVVYFISDSASRPFASPLFASFCSRSVLLDFIRFSVCFEVKYLLVSSIHWKGGKWSVLSEASDKGFEYEIRIDSSQTTEKQQLSKVSNRNVFLQGSARFFSSLFDLSPFSLLPATIDNRTEPFSIPFNPLLNHTRRISRSMSLSTESVPPRLLGCEPRAERGRGRGRDNLKSFPTIRRSFQSISI